MYLSIILTLLVIETEDSVNVIKLNEIQAIEMVDKGSNDGGILTITLKGSKSEQIVLATLDDEKWQKAKKWLNDGVFNLSKEMSRNDIEIQRTVEF